LRAGEPSVRAAIIKKDVNAMAWRTVPTLMLAAATAQLAAEGRSSAQEQRSMAA
jgi:hypothetical protein